VDVFRNAKKYESKKIYDCLCQIDEIIINWNRKEKYVKKVVEKWY